MIPGCYIIHISPAYKHAGHYLGGSRDIPWRFGLHITGQGGKLCKVAVESGCDLVLARIFPTATADEAYRLEAKLKARHDTPALCPICRGEISAEDCDRLSNFALPEMSF